MPKRQQDTVTLAEFREVHNCSGESVLDIAYDAQYIADDPDFVTLAKAALAAEDAFVAAMSERDIQIG